MSNISRNVASANLAKENGKFSAQWVGNMVGGMMNGAKKEAFVTSIVSAFNNTPALQACTNRSILSAALQGNALELSPSPVLGHFYMVPYKDRKTGQSSAQFQLGYKGYIQLAIRSGQYRKINVLEIREGELLGWNPMSEQISVQIIEDDAIRNTLPVVGYYAMFELTNGFQKAVYWSKAKMEEHAKTYSQAYRWDVQKGEKNSFWSKNFDEMAFKTLIRHLISKWGVMSIAIQSAIETDMTINDNGSVSYVDNDLIDVQVVEPVQSANPVDDFFS